jgi:hypothetical protein
MQLMETPYFFAIRNQSGGGWQKPGQNMVWAEPEAKDIAAILRQVRCKVSGKAQLQGHIARDIGKRRCIKSETFTHSRIKRLKQGFFRRKNKGRVPRGGSGQKHAVAICHGMSMQCGKGLTLCHRFDIYTWVAAPHHKAGHKAAGMADRPTQTVGPNWTAVGGTPYWGKWQRQLGNCAGCQQATGKKFAKTTIMRSVQRIRQWNAADVEQAAVKAAFIIAGQQQHSIGATNVDPVLIKHKLGWVVHLILHQNALRTEHRMGRKGQGLLGKLETWPHTKATIDGLNRVLHRPKRVAGRTDIKARADCANLDAKPVTQPLTPQARGMK